MSTPRHLRIVRPDEPPSPPKKRRKLPRRRFTDEQRLHLAAALRNLKLRYGPWRRVAEAMGVAEGTLISVVCRNDHGGSMALAVRAAELLGVTVERIMSGTLASTGKCPHCGQKLPEPEED